MASIPNSSGEVRCPPLSSMPRSANSSSGSTGPAAPPYRERQICDWIFSQRAESFESMSNLPRELRRKLEADWRIFSMNIMEARPASDGARKFLFECSDGRRIESVLMSEGVRRTLCVSTQVGCGMGCVFCASGLAGLVRNLSAGEILEQMIRAHEFSARDRTTHACCSDGNGRKPCESGRADSRA